MSIYRMSPADIQEKIREHLPVKEAEKNKYGEVFTPQSLIEEMLNKLPTTIWQNPKLKWLDPANGVGNFPMIVFQKLNDGLKNVRGYKTDKKRKRHIIENMLYMVELNPVNVAVSKKIFGEDANIYCGSFLEDGWKDAFKIEKFDVVLGNPPFNKPKDGIYGGRTLWDKFILKSLDNLTADGYMGFINPANWRGLGQLGFLWKILSNKQLLYLRIYGIKDGKKIFNAGTRFDIYVLQNKDNTSPTEATGTTEVIDELGEKHLIKLDGLPFLANYNYDGINKILTTQDEGVDVIYSSSIYDSRKLSKGIDVIFSSSFYHAQKLSKEKTDGYKYPVVHTITKDGLGFWYSNDNTKGHFGVPKVILNFNRLQYSYPEQNDYEGKYGMSQLSFGIPINSKEEGDLILQAVDTPEFKKIISATKWGAFQTDYRMFKHFKKDFYNIYLTK